MSNTSDQTTKQNDKTRLIVGEVGIDTETGIVGKGHSYDNGKTFTVDDTIYGRIYHADDHDKIWKGIQDQVAKVVDPAKSAADSAVSAADAAVASAQVTSAATSDIASATAEAKAGANEAMSRALSAWDVATGAKEAVTDFDPLLKSAQSDAGKALTQIADTASALSDAKTAFGSDVAAAKELASTAQTTANSAVKSASSVASDLTAVASQAKSNANGITKVTSDVGLLQTTVADNSGNISKIQETAAQIQQAVSDNAGNITVAKQTADSAVAVASDARSNVTVAIQTASQASITAQNASGQAASAMLTANGALTTASNAKSDATVAVQTASGASLTATNAQSDATIAKQTASEATVQASNAESDFAQISIRANKIEANVATNSGAIASVQQTANGLTTTVADIKANGGGVNLAHNTSTAYVIPGDTDGYKNIGSLSNDEWVALAGETITIGVTVEWTNWQGGGNNRLGFELAPAKNGNGYWNNGFSLWCQPAIGSSGKQRLTVTRTLNDDIDGIDEGFAYVQGGCDTAKISELMIERGSIAHDWSPAPDDLQSQFTQIKQSVNGVATTINDPKTGLNATYQTAAGNSSTISSVKGDVTQLQATANGLTSRVGSLESKTDTQQTAIDQNKAAIALKADQTDVNTLKGTVSENTATLKTQADQIQSKVSASDVTGMLNGYATQNYAQSLVTQTADKWNLNLTNLKTDVNAIKTTGGGVNLACNTSTAYVIPGDPIGSKNIGSLSNDEWTALAGETITIGVTIEWTNWQGGGNNRLGFEVAPAKNGTTDWDNAFSLWCQPAIGSSGKQRLTVTKTLIDGIDGFDEGFAYVQGGCDTAKISELMIERGSIAHDWSPAPSDMATVTSVTNLSATVNGIQSQVYNSDGSSRITQLSGLIQSKVGTDDFNNLKQAVNLQTLDSADINNMKTNGHYFVHNLSNNPIGGWVYVDVTGDGSTRIRQDVYQDNGTKHQYRRWVDTNWTDWEEGATYTEINQLQDKINLRVTKGDLISQINLQTGASLIQSDKLVLDANTTVITGNTFIPSAAIANLTADQIQAGTLSGSTVHAGDNSGNAIDMGVLSTDYVGFHSYATNGDNTYIDLNGIHNYGASYDTRIQQGKITTNYLAVNGGGMIDFRDSNGTGMIAEGSTLKFDVRNISAGYLSCGGAPLADWPSGSVGNELKIMYGGSLAIAASSDTNSRALFSTVDTQIGYYQQGDTPSNWGLTGLKIDNSDRDINLGVYGSDGKWSRLLADPDSIELNANDTHCHLDDGWKLHFYRDNDNNSATAVELQVDGWAWVRGYVEAMGINQHSVLSAKTRIEQADPDHMLDLINQTELTTFAYKSELADGTDHRHIGPIIDDINDVAQYQIPSEFVAPTKTARDDGNIVGALIGAVQALTKRIKTLEDKLNG